MKTSDFYIVAGTVIGSYHTKRNMNNQDGFDYSITKDKIVAAVTDGVSAGKDNEIGAKLLAKYVVNYISKLSNKEILEEDFNKHLFSSIIDFIFGICSDMGYITHSEPTNDLNEFIIHNFLCTLQILVITPEETLILGVGDGVYKYNDTTEILSSFLNAPDCVSYALTSYKSDNSCIPIVRERLPTKDLSHVLIGSDGLVDLMKNGKSIVDSDGEPIGSLDQFFSQNYREDPLAMTQNRLIDIASTGILRDDTTLVAVIKKQGSPKNKRHSTRKTKFSDFTILDENENN